jgi:hypothetical protein
LDEVVYGAGESFFFGRGKNFPDLRENCEENFLGEVVEVVVA